MTTYRDRIDRLHAQIREAMDRGDGDQAARLIRESFEATAGEEVMMKEATRLLAMLKPYCGDGATIVEAGERAGKAGDPEAAAAARVLPHLVFGEAFGEEEG